MMVTVIAAAAAATLTGTVHASGALLPSATWMTVWCLCGGALLRRRHVLLATAAIFGTLATGWPFGAVAVVPMALYVTWYEVFVRQRAVRFVGMLVAITVIVQALVSYVDYQHYGVWSLPTVNIFTYNAGGNGDSLYGVEPVSYYVKNLLLNTNVVAILGLLAAMVYPIYSLLASSNGRTWAMLATIPAWLAVTVPRPHKEERFLFPIYPALLLGAVWLLDTVIARAVVPLWMWLAGPSSSLANKDDLTLAALRRRRDSCRTAWHVLVWTPVILLSLSRTAALQRYYSAPLYLYSAISAHVLASSSSSTNNVVPEPYSPRRLVCVCGEWYRFPGTLYLPGSTSPDESAWQLGFLPSSFQGQLPQVFSRHGSKAESQSVLQPFNDQNLEQTERYVPSPAEQCAYLVVLMPTDNDPGNKEASCVNQVTRDGPATATVLASLPFLDGDRTSTLHRTLYLPYWHERARQTGQVVYQQYVLYKIAATSTLVHDDED
jgi:alpha-1,2-mannosyltransferase